MPAITDMIKNLKNLPDFMQAEINIAEYMTAVRISNAITIFIFITSKNIYEVNCQFNTVGKR